MRRTRFLLLLTLSLLVLLGLFAGSWTPEHPAAAQFVPTFTPLFQGTYIPPSPTPASCLEPLPFDSGDTIALIGGIAIRSQPNTGAALLIQFPERRNFTVVAGPICQGGFNWWQIRGHGLTGWAAEGRRDVYWMRLIVDATAGEQCLPPLSLVPGERFEVLNNIRIRAEPSTNALTRTIVSADNSVVILGGPRCAEGYNWWQVRATVLGFVYEGWMAEGTRFGEAYIEVPPEGDGTVCARSLMLQPGDRAWVDYNDGNPKNLRSAPDTSAPILYELFKNVPLTILGGPVCSDSYNWWRVRVLSSTPVEGWLSEGGPPAYWIRRQNRSFIPMTAVPED
jgi:hypothetical protein